MGLVFRTAQRACYKEYELYGGGGPATIAATVYDITGSEARPFPQVTHDTSRMFGTRVPLVA